MRSLGTVGIRDRVAITWLTKSHQEPLLDNIVSIGENYIGNDSSAQNESTAPLLEEKKRKKLYSNMRSLGAVGIRWPTRD